MPNIHQVHVIRGEDLTFHNGSLQPYDFSCVLSGNEVSKIVSGVYITIDGTDITEYNFNAPDAEYVTKVINSCNNAVAYLRESPYSMILLATHDCADCRDIQTPIMAGENCTTPMHVTDCERAALLAKIQDVISAINGITITVGDVVVSNVGVEAKLQQLIDIASREYNIQDHYRVTGITPAEPYDTDPTDGTSKIFAADLYHSIDILVEEGVVGVQIGTKKYKHKAGYNRMYTATTLIDAEIIVTAESDDAVCTITTIK